MRLTHFSYKEAGWEIKDGLSLQTVNLLVGKNAVGKSKTIQSLGKAIIFLSQQKESLRSDEFGACFTFEDNGTLFSYHFYYLHGKITREILSVDGTIYIERNEETATLHGQSINPPANKLILHIRRDTVQYPYIEKIMVWAEQACGLSFNEVDIAGDVNITSYLLGKQQNLFTLVESLPKDALQHIVSQAQNLGYPLTKIETIEFTSTLKKVTFQEEGVKDVLVDGLLSKGMFRALYLLIYMKYLSLQTSPSLLLVDDLCEGLDYDRSTKLGKLVFDFCLEHGIQLIASSNDTFLMDVIDLKYWNILQRKNGQITSLNIENHPELFESFRFTGLSNFDFISTDYIQRHLTKTSGNE